MNSGYTFGREATPEEMAAALEGFLNTFSADTKSAELAGLVVESFHRTLVQNYARLVVESIIALADARWVGGRNQASNEAMSKLKGFLEEQGITSRFPHV